MQSVFLELLVKMVPICCYIIMGYIGGRFLNIGVKDLSKMVIYTLFPVIIFRGVYASDINTAFWAFLGLFFIVPVILNALFLFIGKKIWKDETANLWAYSLCNTNYGFFGILTGLAILGADSLVWMITASFGLGLYSLTYGYFSLTLKEDESVLDGIKKTFKLPVVYAFILAVILNFSKSIFNLLNYDFYNSFMATITDTYLFSGMAILGVVISQCKMKFDWKFFLSGMFFKTVGWLLLGLAVIFVDKIFFKIFDSNLVYNVILLFSLLPVGIMAVSVPTLLDYKEESIAKAAYLVTVSSILMIILVPLIFAVFSF